MTQTTPQQRPTGVYRIYDADGALLYVGITDRPKVRMRVHRHATWASRLASITWEYFPSRALAEKREVEIIAERRPPHNVRVDAPIAATEGRPLCRVCLLDGITRAATTSHGWCDKHYRRWLHHGDPLYERPRVCSISTCPESVLARGWCNKHYLRWRIHGDPLGGAPERSRAPVDERFWSWIEIGDPNECWEWRGGRLPHGYGNFRVNGRNERGSRMAWILTHGEIENGLHVLHSCDNPPCCNPAHLFLGTHAENMADMAEKGRYRVIAQPGERNPQAKLTEASVVAIRRAYAAGELQRVLALRFGVSRSLIGQIVTRKIWTHVPPCADNAVAEASLA